METKLNNLQKKNRLAFALLALGVLLFVLGEILRAVFPAAVFNFKIVSALGILAAGLGLGNVVMALTVRGDPLAARRLAIAESDERSRAIRQQAGSAAFVLAFLLNALVLIIYSGMTAGQPGFDLLWWVLAGLVLVPSLFYLAMLVWLNQK